MKRWTVTTRPDIEVEISDDEAGKILTIQDAVNYIKERGVQDT